MYPLPRWQIRLDWVIRLLQWATLALGVFVSFLRAGLVPTTLLAAVLAGAYVVGSQAVPRRLLTHRWVTELVAVSGVILVAAAVSLSGGLGSPYLILNLMPVIFAAAFWGLRVGLETAALGAGALVALTVGTQPAQDVGQAIAWSSLHFLMAATVGYSRRLLTEADGYRSDESTARMQRLEAAHGLLSRLAELADTAELNPVSVGEAALDNLASLIPYETGTVALSGDEGPVVVARRNYPEHTDADQGGPRDRLFHPLRVGEREVGVVVLARAESFSDPDHELIEEALRPAALAFANVLLLQDIARRAVQEERTRLARELHDEIGPSLASLGLALDLALVQGAMEPAAAGQLATLRSSVAGVVEEVRSVVADLREPDHPSVTEHLRALQAEVPTSGPELIIGLEEHRPPRPSVLPDLTAILSEATRNAVRHSGARQLVVSGWVDRETGSIRIKDDGRGFDPNAIPDGRFGLVGMRERAALIEVELLIDSELGAGTTVEVRW